jgi:uncharacterized protein (TIRG00374 family)
MNRWNLSQPAIKRIIILARAGGSVLLIWWAVAGINWSDLGIMLHNLVIWPLLWTPPLYFLGVWLSTYRWKLILKNWGIEQDIRVLLKIYIISAFWSNFLPSTIGGDGYRYLALRSLPQATNTKIFSSLLLDRLYGYLALVIVHFVVAAFYWNDLQNSAFLLGMELSILTALPLLGVFWLVASRLLKSREPKISTQGWMAKALNKIGAIITLLQQQNLRTSAWGFFLSVLLVGTIALAWQIYYLSAGMQVDWGIAFYAATLIGILGILPITLNGIGVMEICQIMLLSWQGLPEENAILVALLTRVMMVVLTLPGGLLYLLDSLKSHPTLPVK